MGPLALAGPGWAGDPRRVRAPVDEAMDPLERAPRLVLWETTKACPLACAHCRAVAEPDPAPGELGTAEGVALIDELAGARRPRPVLVLSGGDCLARADLLALLEHAQAVGVPVALAPAVSPRLTPALAAGVMARGVGHVSLSLDGATPSTHDTIRRVPGHLAATVATVEMLVAAGLSVQVNTVVMPANLAELAELAVRLHRLGVGVWEVFFLVAVGRGQAMAEIGAEAAEDVCHLLVDVAERGLVVRTVEAPFYRRVQHERALAGAAPPRSARHARLRRTVEAGMGPAVVPVRPPREGTRDGKGIVFVAHDGEVYPSGFLPRSLGNVRRAGLLPIYRDHPVLRAIRAGAFPGRCGACRHRDLCGGSRARAYAATGDPLGDAPACVLAGPAGGGRAQAIQDQR